MFTVNVKAKAKVQGVKGDIEWFNRVFILHDYKYKYKLLCSYL